MDKEKKQVEQYIIFCLTQGRQEVIDYIFCNVTETNFINGYEKYIFKKAKELWNNKKEIDIVTISDAVEKNDNALGYLIEISELLPSDANYKTYVETLIYNSNTRDILKACSEYSINTNEETLDKLKTAINNTDKDINIQKNLLPDVMNRCLIQYDTKKDNTKDYLRTGLKKIDYTMKIQPKEVVIIAGRPGEGKSALSMQMAKDMAKSGKNILVFNLEMSATSLGNRLIANEGNINFSDIQNGNRNIDLKNLYSATKRLRLENFEICDQIFNIDKIISKCKVENARKRLDCVLIDYIGLISATGKFANDNARLTYISRQLKLLASELDIPVVVLSQFSREVEKQNRIPRLSDLRDSGSLEQDASIVILLSKNKELNEKYNSDEETYLNAEIAKNRNGRTGFSRLKFTGRFMKFEEVDKEGN